ncbi:hypothetical protein LX32DRAFT_734019 [Colletotrichum zoysiae]|uniref:Uncharacterized protein n=1 Tax=Colletotrichum zoysiae TaxID=1216348 RepID=A0AAD9LVZ8_9PEZI|nr:hypothetical protein LX32DRAFT_734019 [Colletotrichum zoysiae]
MLYENVASGFHANSPYMLSPAWPPSSDTEKVLIGPSLIQTPTIPNSASDDGMRDGADPSPHQALEAQVRQLQAQVINQTQQLYATQATANRYKQIINSVAETLGQLHQTLLFAFGGEASQAQQVCETSMPRGYAEYSQ